MGTLADEYIINTTFSAAIVARLLIKHFSVITSTTSTLDKGPLSGSISGHTTGVKTGGRSFTTFATILMKQN